MLHWYHNIGVVPLRLLSFCFESYFYTSSTGLVLHWYRVVPLCHHIELLLHKFHRPCVTLVSCSSSLPPTTKIDGRVCMYVHFQICEEFNLYVYDKELKRREKQANAPTPDTAMARNCHTRHPRTYFFIDYTS